MSWWKRALFTIVGLLQRVPVIGPPIRTLVNRIMVNAAVGRCRERPHPWSTAHDYISWTSLSDRSFSARHLPAAAHRELPDADDVVALFARPMSADGGRLSDGSTLLFPAFAQYLTDGFIRTRMPSEGDDQSIRLQNTSNHEIDLCTLYGRTPTQTRALRVLDASPNQRGRLKSQMIGREEFPPFLFDDQGSVDPQFEALDPPLGVSGIDDADQRRHILAVGGDRVNAVPQVAMINTLLLREHNRLAHDIGLAHPEWDGDRVFETVRNCMIVMFIKIVVEEYINHISPIPLDFVADPSVAWNARWNKPNWITTEFSLLYRWHSLIPDTIRLNGQVRPVHTTFMDNRPLLNGGLLNSFRDIAGQRAGQLGPRNTTPALLHLERAAIEQGRLARLAPYADYKAYMSKTGRRPQRFEDVSSDPDVIAVLRAAYRDVGDIEFYVGLFAEDADPNSPLPKLLGEMVAVDAFSQALTNPLLSKHVMSRRTDAFSTVGWEAVAATSTLRDVLRRHVAAGTDVDDITMDVRA